MNNISELKQHLSAVAQTRQITNAMYLLSTSRMKKSMQSIDFNLNCMRNLRTTMKSILSESRHSALDNRFTRIHRRGRAIFLFLTADKGLCGGFNASVVNLGCKKLKSFKDPIICSLGVEGSEMLRSRGITPAYEWFGASQRPTLQLARLVAEKIVDLYEDKTVNEAYIVYTEYVNSAVQKSVCKRILPLLYQDFSDIESECLYNGDPLYEPSVEVVFDCMAEQYLVVFMYNAFMQASACENCARMTAMQNATRNADKMIGRLTAQINSQRQLAITNEITEIAAATEISGAV